MQGTKKSKLLRISWNIFTARKRSLGQGNIFTGVCLSTEGSGGCVNLGRGCVSRRGCAHGRCVSRGVCVHLLDTQPQRQPPWTPSVGHTHTTVNKRAVRILLKCKSTTKQLVSQPTRHTESPPFRGIKSQKLLRITWNTFWFWSVRVGTLSPLGRSVTLLAFSNWEGGGDLSLPPSLNCERHR